MMKRGALALGSLLIVAAAACGTDTAVFGSGGAGGSASGVGGSGTGAGTGTGTGTGEGGTSTGTPAGASTGIGGECMDVTDCPVPDTPCVLVECVNETCVVSDAPAGTSCGQGQECDGMGSCVGSLGSPCAEDDECASGQCADEVCCDTACDGACEACNVSGVEGTCTPHAPGTDPEDECMPGVCDGGTACVSGEHISSATYGGSGSQFARDVAVDAAGNVYVIGYFFDTIDLGGGAFTSAGFRDMFVVKYDPMGAHLWSKHFSDPNSIYAWEIEIDGAGDVVVAGRFFGGLDFGVPNQAPFVTAGGLDLFVAKLDPNTGDAIWAKQFGDPDNEQLWGLDINPATNEIAIGGYFQGNIDLGGGAILGAGSNDGFVAKLDSSGNHVWSQTYGDSEDQRVYDVGFDPNGDVIVAGRHIGSIDFGAGALTSAGARDIFVAKLGGANGAVVWANQYGDGDDQLAWAIDVDASGNIAVAGYNWGAVDFGGGAVTSNGGQDAVVAMLDGMGNHLWSLGWGGPANQEAEDIHVDGLGRVIVTGQAQGDVDFGGGLLTGNGQIDAYLVKLTAGGDHLWSYLFGGPGIEIGNGVTTNMAHEIYFVGQHSSPTDFGGGPLLASGGFDAFVAKFAP